MAIPTLVEVLRPESAAAQAVLLDRVESADPFQPDEREGAVEVIAAAEHDGVVVAVGRSIAPGEIGIGEVRILRSEDGDTWEQVTLGEEATAGWADVADVSASGDGFVLLGSVGTSSRIWRSVDGRAWQPADYATGRACGDPSPETVVPLETGLVVLGTTESAGCASPTAPVEPVFHLAAHVAGDGGELARVESPAFDLEIGFGMSAAAVGQTVLVAADDPEGAGTILFMSEDAGATWRHLGSATDVLGGEHVRVRGVDVVGDQFLLMGQVGPPGYVDASLWLADGDLGDVRQIGGEDVFGGDGEQRAIAATTTDDGVVVVGTSRAPRGDVGRPSVVEVWSSPDLDEWTRAPLSEETNSPDELTAVDVHSMGDEVVVVGGARRAPTEDEKDQRAEESARGDVTSRIDRHTEVAVWTGSWTQVDIPARASAAVVAVDDPALGGDAEQLLNDVVVHGDRLIAVGSTQVGDEDDPGSVHREAQVWRSHDGESWTPVDAADAFGGEGDQEMRAVTVAGDGLVAVGRSGDDVAVWSSPDGDRWDRVPHDPAVFGGGRAWGVAAMPGGSIVAVGRNVTGEMSLGVGVWSSPDGTAWQRVELPTDVFGLNTIEDAFDVHVDGEVVTVVGDVGTPEDDPGGSYRWTPTPTIWRSIDGMATWSVESAATGYAGLLSAVADDVVLGWSMAQAPGPGVVRARASGVWGEAEDGWVQLELTGLPTGAGLAWLAAEPAGSEGEMLLAGALSEHHRRDAVLGVVDGSTVEVIDLPGQLGGDGRDEIAGLAVFGDRGVAVGSRWTSTGDFDGAVWLVDLPRPP